MIKKEFLKLMSFPKEWILWDMYPDELASIQMAEYQQGHEEAAEHTRFGAFLWWISKVSCRYEYDALMKLSYLDIDQGMAEHARLRLKEKWKKESKNSN